MNINDSLRFHLSALEKCRDGDDTEKDHALADDILQTIVYALGECVPDFDLCLVEVILETYEAVPKWYS